MPLTKIDMTRYPVTGWQTTWLAQHGFRVKIEGDRLYMVRPYRRRFLSALFGGRHVRR